MEELKSWASILTPLLVVFLGYLLNRQSAKLTRVEKQTDGLASALAVKTGQVERAAGIKETVDAAAVVAAAKAEQIALIESIVTRLAARTDPGPVVAREIGVIKGTVQETLPRVVNIEDAVVKTDQKVSDVKAVTDDRLDRLEDKS